MPDKDNIANSFPKGWGNTLREAVHGPEHLAQYLGHLTTREIRNSGDLAEALPLLEGIIPALMRIAEQTDDLRISAKFNNALFDQDTREKLIVLKAGDRVWADMLSDPGRKFSLDEVRQKLYEAFCLEIPRVFALGILSLKGIPSPFADENQALAAQAVCENKLRQLLQPVAEELALDPVGHQVTPIRRPPKQEVSQEVMTGVEIRVNLGSVDGEDE